METIRFGVLGLRRGSTFVNQILGRADCRLAAVCEWAAPLRERFAAAHPEVRVAESYEELLAAGIDAVVLASFCPEHAPQAVQALRAGKHVLSEVTAFHTPAEGVALVRAVEQSGLTYMMAENTCYFPVCEEMKRLAHAGRMGEFMYAECEYVHAIGEELAPAVDGALHWRSWQPGIYYCTHSLGPVFQMAQDRPVSVVGMDCGMKMRPDGPVQTRPDVAVALIRMAGGGLVKLLISFANHREPPGHFYVFYGTGGNMENDRMRPDLLHVREPQSSLTQGWLSYTPTHQRLAQEAVRSGHGGADYFVLHDFVEAVRTGTPPPVDVYAAADMTLPGILAYRSACRGGQPLEVPDFREESARRRYEADHESPRPGG